jgi:hypothetical protein
MRTIIVRLVELSVGISLVAFAIVLTMGVLR